ncbi:MAG TPA: histidine phosphatase family protein [Bryobacteraceae bacterium]|nr:histidine phosphatase family protein [Bryobacteraceae bacterium]
MAQELWLIRHGETEWSLSGAHTGLTDLPLTDRGRTRAAKMRCVLSGCRFALVLTSPMARARETCRLAGFGDAAQVEANLCEWNYGDYEGRTTNQIRAQSPSWNLWVDGVPNGETIDQVADRARAVIARAQAAPGNVALFAHGHILRILTACWLDLPPQAGRLFALGTASVSRLGNERENHVIAHWNQQEEACADGADVGHAGNG